MANPHRGEVQFEAGGKHYTIRLSTNAICGLESELGVGFGEITRRLDGFNFLTLRSVMRAALGPNTSVAEAAAVIDELGYAEAVNQIMESYRLAYPLPNGEDTASPRTGGEAGIGLNS
jgi:hypothetical protein